MTGTRAAVLIAGIAGISLVSVAAVVTGHDGMVITGAMSAITGITGSAVAYYKGRETERRSLERRGGIDGDTKTDSSGKA